MSPRRRFRIRLPCTVVAAAWAWIPTSAAGFFVDDTLRSAGEFSLEQAAEERAEDERAAGEIEWLSWLLDHPLDLQTVRREQLESLPGVSPAHAAAFLAFRDAHEHPLTAADIRVFGGRHATFLRAVIPFTTTRELRLRGRLEEPFLDVRARFSRDLQPCAGALSGAFAGSTLHAYDRLTLTPASGVRLGVVAEKDAGEDLAHGFYSAYVTVSDLLPEGIAVAGDYRVSVGRGLVLGRSAAFGVSSDPVATLARSGLGLEPNRSTDGLRFMRGLGISGVPGAGVRLTAFYSDRKVAASVHEDGCAGALDETGLFRTAAEIAHFGSVRVRAGGGGISWERGALYLGVTLLHAAFSRRFAPQDPAAFAGSAATVGSVDARWQGSDLLFFGEAARGPGGESAFFAGGLLEAGVRTSCGFTLRRYSRSFFSPFGQAYAQSDGMRNEEGAAFAVETSPVRPLRLTAFLDLFRHPAPTSARLFPAGGIEHTLEGRLQVNADVTVTARYAHRRSESVGGGTDSLGRTSTAQAPRSQERLRLTIEYRPSRILRVRGRGEWTFVRFAPGGGAESGALLWQDVRLEPAAEVTLEARVAIFDARSYDARIAMMENDLPGVFSVPALFGRGIRWYLLASVRPLEAVRVAVRYAETRKEGVGSLGSGVMEVWGDTDNTLGLQVDVRL